LRKPIGGQLTEVKTHVSTNWLSEPDADGEFPTNSDRFTAQELTKWRDTEGFARKGFICQAIAAAYHNKSIEQLQQIAEKVGRERIQVVHETMNNLITVPHAQLLVKELEGEEAGREDNIQREGTLFTADRSYD
ncbi:hypothetical protein MMC24_007826, partial [Lignoscripta atroalba]|nr:hypothetical protein [Lignoscripta atroalba]